MLERLDEEFPGGDPAAIRAEFEEIVSSRLEAWLAGGFFARHISQFKKRPVAWQLQSQPAAQPGRRRSASARGPVFACLVYYHRLDADLLPKLRSHYLGGLRNAYETEPRTLEALAKPTGDPAEVGMTPSRSAQSGSAIRFPQAAPCLGFFECQ